MAILTLAHHFWLMHQRATADFVSMDDQRTRVLTKKNGSIDFKMLRFYLTGAFLQLCLLSIATYTFKLSQIAGVNAGVSSSVWALGPFFSALLEKLVRGTSLKRFHIVGMSLMLCAVVIVSLSDVVTP